jgi:glycine oxidase
MDSDVLIIGGGVIGLSIARELRKRGAGRITVVEKGKLGREASWAAAGMLAPQAETDRIDDFYRFCTESRDIYPEFAADLLAETGVDIELERSGTLYAAFNADDVGEIERRFSWQRSAGLDVERLSSAECLSCEPNLSRDVLGGLFFPRDWQVENRRLVEALTEFARRNGIEIVENTEVIEISEETGEARCRNGKSFHAGRTVLATGAWTSLIKIGELALPVDVRPIRGQMISFAPPERLFRRVIYSPRGYVVPRLDGRLLAGATVEDAGFHAENTAEGLEKLRATAAEISPDLQSLGIVDNWAGLRPFAADGLPIIGEIGQNLFVATAHYRNGILLAPLTGRIMAKAMFGDEASTYLQVFGPNRLKAVGKGS